MISPGIAFATASHLSGRKLGVRARNRRDFADSAASGRSRISPAILHRRRAGSSEARSHRSRKRYSGVFGSARIELVLRDRSHSPYIPGSSIPGGHTGAIPFPGWSSPATTACAMSWILRSARPNRRSRLVEEKSPSCSPRKSRSISQDKPSMCARSPSTGRAIRHPSAAS